MASEQHALDIEETLSCTYLQFILIINKNVSNDTEIIFTCIVSSMYFSIFSLIPALL